MEGTIYPLLDRVLDGKLADQLHEWRAVQGLSFAAISKRLLVDHDVDVSTDTIRRWLDELGIEKAKAS